MPELSSLQVLRRNSPIYYPDIKSFEANTDVLKVGRRGNEASLYESLRKEFPHLIANAETAVLEDLETGSERIGVVLSGGQAAGGHNVIVGLSDELWKREGELIGFLEGPGGLIKGRYIRLTKNKTDEFRNLGGFDMLGSGRDKIEREDELIRCAEVCKDLKLDGLVIIGGDDSCTNAAVLANFFKGFGCRTCVIGVPKTIDGDLRNEDIEMSFGFDTAVKVYSEEVGSMGEYCKSSRGDWHFVRLMGRSASHLTVETALQTRPNIVLVGEEIEAQQGSWLSIVRHVCKLMLARREVGKDYGILLLPEGLIEFIPEMKLLFKEMNALLAGQDFKSEKLSAQSRILFESFPNKTKSQLLLDRDPHGNVQVSRIATEELLAYFVTKELAETWSVTIHTQFLGYEGRCAMPSCFDANYCYALARAAGALIRNHYSGYMACLKNLSEAPAKWKIHGKNLLSMMDFELRHGKKKPVIKKYLIDLNSEYYTFFKKKRKEWLLADMMTSPGPLQYWGVSANDSNCTLDLSLYPQGKITNLAQYLNARSCVARTFTEELKGFPKLKAHAFKTLTGKVALCLVDEIAPGTSNVVIGLSSRLEKLGAKLSLFPSPHHLLSGKMLEIGTKDLHKYENLPGASFLSFYKYKSLLNEKNLFKIVENVKKSVILYLVLMGGKSALRLSQAIKPHLPDLRMIVAPVSISDDFLDPELSVIGAKTALAGASHILGNLSTDLVSAAKYYYLVQFEGFLAGSPPIRKLTEACRPNYVCGLGAVSENVDSAVSNIYKVISNRVLAKKKYGCVIIPDDLITRDEIIRRIRHKLSHSGAKTIYEAEQELDPHEIEYLNKLCESAKTDIFKRESEMSSVRIIAECLEKRLSDYPVGAGISILHFDVAKRLQGLFPCQYDVIMSKNVGSLIGEVIIGNYGYTSMVVTCENVKRLSEESKLVPRILDIATMGTAKSYPTPELSAMTEDNYANPGPTQYFGPANNDV